MIRRWTDGPARTTEVTGWRGVHKVRRFFETTPGGVDGLVAQYLPPGKDEDEDPEVWRGPAVNSVSSHL